MSRSVSFVTTVYRTRDLLPRLLEEIRDVATASFSDYEVIVVDDGCPERSGDVAVGYQRTRVLRLPSNSGQRTATLVGLGRTRFELVCVLDGDLQDDPRHVPGLIAELERTGADVVCAGRSGFYDSLWRRWSGRIFRLVRWAVTRGRVPRDAGLFHVATADAATRMLQVALPGDDPLICYVASGSALRSLPVPRRRRPSGGSAYSTWDRLRVAVQGLVRSRFPAQRPSSWPEASEVTAGENR